MHVPTHITECIRLAAQRDIPYLEVRRETDGTQHIGWVVTLADSDDSTYSLFTQAETIMPPIAIRSDARGEHDTTIEAVQCMIEGMEEHTVEPAILDDMLMENVIVGAVQQGWNVSLDHMHHTRDLLRERNVPDHAALRFHAGFSMPDQPEVQITITVYGQRDGEAAPATYTSTAQQESLAEAVTTVLRPAPCAMTTERIERTVA